MSSRPEHTPVRGLVDEAAHSTMPASAHGAWGSSVTGIVTQLFTEARTFSYWQARPVPDGLVEAAFDWPFSARRCELRAAAPGAGAQPAEPRNDAVLRRRAITRRCEQRRFLPRLSHMTGRFSELLPRLYPRSDVGADGSPPIRRSPRIALRNSSLQRRLFHLGLARPWARLRADVRVRRRQGQCRVLPRRPMAGEFSVEHWVRRSRPAAPQAATPRL